MSLPGEGNFIIEFNEYTSYYWNWLRLDFQEEDGTDHLIGVLSTSYDNGANAPIKTTYFPSQNTLTPLSIKFENGVVSVDSNGSNKGTTTINYDPVRFITSGTNTITNAKIKRLN